jgi:dihydroxyacetone kinase DhaKLM complex PTS-EIIA-like component DhaM
VLLAVGADVNVMIDVLPQKRHATQVRVTMDMGATRMEEEKVVEIKCLEA